VTESPCTARGRKGRGYWDKKGAAEAAMNGLLRRGGRPPGCSLHALCRKHYREIMNVYSLGL